MGDPAPGKAELDRANWLVAAHIQSDAVETAKIKDDAVDNDKLANITRGYVKVGGVSDAPTDLHASTDAQILIGDGTDVVSVAVSGDAAIASSGAVTIGADAITSTKADIFLSAETTGAGSATPIVHGLGASPPVFFPLVTEHATSADLNMSATADATNVYVTAAATVKFKVFAWL